MIYDFNLDSFISEFVTKRRKSLLSEDLSIYQQALFQEISNSTVLVIGGAGTIGSHYIKALLKFNVSKLVIVDTNENGLTELIRDLRSSDGYSLPKDLITYPLDFGSAVFEKVLTVHGPFDIVANFAAHKHVRSEKDIFSVEAMLENNVIKAKRLLDLLLNYPPRHFFCVSTDKAANPVNIMGASKKLMEELIVAYSDIIPTTTARFANVAFSNGSLLQGFIDRLIKKQPWSCPRGIRRFFVSPRESGELCLIASILGKPGEIFFPKLDENDMIPFDKIALDFLEYLDLKPDICMTEQEAIQKSLLLNSASSNYPVYFFDSDTSGEKVYEEFYTEHENLDMNSFTVLGVIKNARKRPIVELVTIIDQLKHLLKQPNVDKLSIVEALKSYLPNFDHIETGKSLDSKM